MFKDTEDSNFYYKITDLNISNLVSLISVITDKSFDEIQKYVNEIESDISLKNDIEIFLKNSGYGNDISVEFGRRVGWYIFTRVTKPKVVVETGVSHGVGALVLTSALLRNEKEGFKGKYYGTDLDKNAGKLLRGVYATIGEIIFGDSITSLKQFDKKIDLFINDSDHSKTYEADEYQIIKSKLGPNAIILGDNSHSNNVLEEFSSKNERSFIFFKEIPKNHWYPGAGIGISFNRK